MSKPFYLVSKTTEKYPYFYKNNLIDKNIYLMQEAQNISNALFIIDTWNRYNFNAGNIDRYQSDINISYTLYYYKDKNNISSEKINGGNDNMKIMVYKKDDLVKYVSMLKYN